MKKIFDLHVMLAVFAAITILSLQTANISFAKAEENKPVMTVLEKQQHEKCYQNKGALMSVE